jgi:hypothetical protein
MKRLIIMNPKQLLKLSPNVGAKVIMCSEMWHQW